MSVKSSFKICFYLLFVVIPATFSAHAMSKKEFIATAFSQQSTNIQPEVKTLWLDAQLQSKIKAILDHQYPKLRLRYWSRESGDKKQSVWFLDEIGKELPISFAVNIINNRVQLIKVLKFRESRGGEIRMQSFTDQFNGIGVKENKLDKSIDGITGATMSVNAMKKITKLALMLHREIYQ